MSSRRVRGISVTEDQDGYLLVAPDLGDILLTPDERVGVAIKKMANGTVGGRSKVAQPIVPTAQAKQLIGAVPAATCLSESFSTGDTDTLGPDLSWLVYDDFQDHAQVHVNDQQASIFFDPPALKSGTGGAGGWLQARAEADVSSANMEVTLTASTVPDVSGSSAGDLFEFAFGAFARSGTFTSTSWPPSDPAAFQSGFQNFWLYEVGTHHVTGVPDGLLHLFHYHELECFFWSPEHDDWVFSTVIYEDEDAGATGVPHVAEGDTVSIAVSGTGASTVVSCAVNGVESINFAGSALTSWASTAYFGGAVDLADLPSGTRGGFTLTAHMARPGTLGAAQSDLVRVDDWRACPI